MLGDYLPSVACSEECMLCQLPTVDGASPSRAGGRISHKAAFLLHRVVQPTPQNSLGHLHTAREHTQGHRLVVVAACTKLHIIPISASDLNRFAWEKERSRLRCSPQHGGVHHRCPPSPHQQHTHPPPSWWTQIKCACMMRVCQEEQKGGVQRGSAQRAVSRCNYHHQHSN